MSQPVSKSAAIITDFTGLKTATGRVASGDDIQTAAIQINLTSVNMGKMVTRAGIRPVQFEEDSE